MRNSSNRLKSTPPKLYRDFQESAIKDQELRRTFAAKSLNVPYDTMGNITVTHNHESKNNLMPLLLSAALAASGGAGGMAIWSALNAPQKPSEQVKPATDTDTRYELRMID